VVLKKYQISLGDFLAQFIFTIYDHKRQFGKTLYCILNSFCFKSLCNFWLYFSAR